MSTKITTMRLEPKYLDIVDTRDDESRTDAMRNMIVDYDAIMLGSLPSLPVAWWCQIISAYNDNANFDPLPSVESLQRKALAIKRKIADAIEYERTEGDVDGLADYVASKMSDVELLACKDLSIRFWSHDPPFHDPPNDVDWSEIINRLGATIAE